MLVRYSSTAALRRLRTPHVLSRTHRFTIRTSSSTHLPSTQVIDDALDPDNTALVQAYKRTGPSSHVNQITLALAPPEQPDAQLPPRQLADLDLLYEVLLDPMPALPTQQERLAKRSNVVEALDTEAFFALPGQDALDPESWAHRIRCLGAMGRADAALAAVEEMEEAGLRGFGPRPDDACLRALADAHSRAGDIDGVREVITRAKARRFVLNAPYYTSLIGAHRRARTEDAALVCLQILEECRAVGATEDAPLHTAIICWHLAEGRTDEAWPAYHHARIAGCPPDAVTFTAMMVACAQGDRLEQARQLQMEMTLHKVYPTLATHNAFINVCAARAKSLVELDEAEHKKLRRLNVDIDVQSPIKDANTQLQVRPPTLQ